MLLIGVESHSIELIEEYPSLKLFDNSILYGYGGGKYSNADRNEDMSPPEIFQKLLRSIKCNGFLNKSATKVKLKQKRHKPYRGSPTDKSLTGAKRRSEVAN